jgi:phosphatidylglycerophosphatase A
MKKIAELVATGFYLGYSPVVPATVGAAFGSIVYWFLMPRSTTTESLVTAGVIILAIMTSGKAEERFGKDGRRIVIDEVAGMFVSLCFLPKRALVFLVAFVIFRVFDVLKPFPANRLEKLPGGWGVVADDVFAGIYTNVLIRILLAIGGM